MESKGALPQICSACSPSGRPCVWGMCDPAAQWLRKAGGGWCVKVKLSVWLWQHRRGATAVCGPHTQRNCSHSGFKTFSSRQTPTGESPIITVWSAAENSHTKDEGRCGAMHYFHLVVICVPVSNIHTVSHYGFLLPWLPVLFCYVLCFSVL